MEMRGKSLQSKLKHYKEMKITIITGRPRKNGNTFAMVDAFIKAAEAKGHKIIRLDAAMMKVFDSCTNKGCHRSRFLILRCRKAYLRKGDGAYMLL